MSKILGVDERFYPTQRGLGYRYLHDDDECEEHPHGIKAVLVAGEIGDYACYMGIGTREWVALNGDKVSFHEACAHFPDLKRENYRD